ncbi:hypothetical protein B0H19DRAFT_448248 [Mycena capillaripes]|nr:hypothetical protein B0H19DRAFT_446086 [Mycena capillaripes]KAJ6533232.1 hypothetical protein B0H19DRAFT_448248 [Mycena capillaripes]
MTDLRVSIIGGSVFSLVMNAVADKALLVGGISSKHLVLSGAQLLVAILLKGPFRRDDYL